MAKKKVQNEEMKTDTILFKEIEGLLFILVAVLGFGEFGIVGKHDKKLWSISLWFSLYIIYCCMPCYWMYFNSA